MNNAPLSQEELQSLLKLKNDYWTALVNLIKLWEDNEQ